MRFLIFTFLFLATAYVAHSEDLNTEAPPVTYDTLLTRLDTHPALEAVRQQVIEQREAANGAGGLPDPMVMFGINNYPADGKGGFDRFAMTSKSIGVVQQIPNGGVRAASILAKQELAGKAQVAVELTRQQLVAALNTALAGRERVARQQDLVAQDIKLLKQEAAYWNGRLQAGDSALEERSRVQAELAQAEARLATLQAETIQFAEELKRLVGDADAVNVPDVVVLPWPNAHAVYPVVLAERDVRVARANEEGAESAFGPNYQVGVTYAQRENSGNFDGGDFASAQFGISIPLWSRTNQKPKLRSAQAGVSRAQAMLTDTRLQWEQQLATQFAKIKETQATRKALHDKEKAITTQVASLRGAYEVDGRLDKLLMAKRNLLGLKLQLAELDARYVQQASQYNAYFDNRSMLELTDAEMSILPRPERAALPTPLPTTSTPSQPLSTGDSL